MFFDKTNTDNFEKLTTIDGLNGANIQRIMYNSEAGVLFIYYIDGSIDLMDSERNIQNIQDIKNNNILVPNKELNAINSYGRYIYLCMPFGMVEYDVVDRIFTNTLSVEGGVSSMAVKGSEMFITSQGNFYKIDRQIKNNISFIGNWTLLNDPVSDPQDKITFHGLTSFNGNILTTFDNILYKLEENNSFDSVDTLKTLSQVKYLNSGSQYLMVGGSCDPDNLPNKGCLGEVALYNTDLQSVDYDRSSLADNTFSIQSDDKIWFADTYHGYRNVSLPGLTPGLIDLNAYSPWTNDVVAIIKTPEALYVAPGGYSQIYLGVGNNQGLFTYKDNFWTVSNLFTDDFFATPETVRDLSSFAYNEDTKELIIGSYHNGIISYKDGERKKFNDKNSALQTAPGDPDNTRVGDVKFDKDGNLWATNVLSPTSMYVRTPDGSDLGFKANLGEIKLIQLTIDPVNQYKWSVEPSKGIVVYDSGENPLSAADDRWKNISVYSEFENTNILPRCIYADTDGRIWIGTLSGVFVIDCGSDIFEADNDCATRFPYIQDENGIGAFLTGQTVNVIREDGAGRKWFGTNSGIYVTNPSVDEVVLHLDPDNSPLAVENVTVLEIDKKSGDVYIGTSAGVQMYKTDASIGNTFHDAKLTIYPNPVKPSYEGPIVIQGLAHDSSVKIADISGKLVFETQSLGGQAIWYGKDLNGNKVGSGVYTILGTTTLNLENPTGIIGKIIYIK